MRAYIAVSFNHRAELDKEIRQVCHILEKAGYNPFVFVDKYAFKKEEEKSMMETAMMELGKSHLLIAETTYKEIGIGIEAGFARAKGIPVIYLRKNTAEHSTTLSGISNYQVIYSDSEDLDNNLQLVLQQVPGRAPV